MLSAQRSHLANKISQFVRSQFTLQAICDTQVIDPDKLVIDPPGSRKARDQCLQGLDVGRSLEADRLAARISCQIACCYNQCMRA